MNIIKKEIHDWIDKENNVITLIFYTYCVVAGHVISYVFDFPWGGHQTIETGIYTYGQALFTLGTLFFLINLFVTRFKVRLIWFVLLFYPQFLYISYTASDGGFFGESLKPYKYTPHAILLFFITEIFYLLIVRKDDISKGEEL